MLPKLKLKISRGFLKNKSHTAPSSNNALATLRDVLVSIGWDPQPEGDTPGFIVDFDPPYIPIAHAYAAIADDLQLFVFYLNFGVEVAPDCRDAVSRFITLANHSLMSGNFELDLEDGLLRFRTSVVFGNQELSASLIRSAILFAMNAVELYAEPLIEVIVRNADPDLAFDRVKQ